MNADPIEKAKRPNVLLICADMASAKHFGCYGDPARITPNVDALAKRGTRFTQAYCASTPCIPARICMMSGQYAHTSAKMLRTGSWKYIYTLVDGQRVEQELYNLKSDPDELYNLAHDPAQAERMVAYRDQILRWLVATEVNRLHPAPENHYPVPWVDAAIL